MMAHILTRAREMLQAEHDPIEPPHAALLLVAIAGGRSPTEAVEAAKVMGGIPLLRIKRERKPPNGLTTTEYIVAADVSIPAGEGEAWAAFRASIFRMPSTAYLSISRLSRYGYGKTARECLTSSMAAG